MVYKFRSGAGTGEWLSFLLPLCLLPLSLKFHESADRLVLLVVILLSTSHFMKRDADFVGFTDQISYYAQHYIPVSILVSWYNSQNVILSSLYCISTILSYNTFISKILSNCPGSFTLGEAQTIAQGIVIFLLHSLISLKQISEHASDIMHTEAMDLLKFLHLGLIVLICCLFIFPSLGKGIKIYFMCFVFAVPMILIWSFYHQENLILWFLEFCMYNHRRFYLFLLWLFLTAASVWFVMWNNQRPGYSASTVDRKFFHLIISAVYISGIIYDMQFLCFASGIALGAYIVLEMYRILKVPLFGPAIEQAFKVFLDEKDSGVLILTHIYLLVGCSSPLWLSSYYISKNKYHISLLSGIISVGFGDTFAAVGGILLGKHHWKGSKKTLEGTACAIVSQLVSSFFFLYIGHPLSLHNIALVVISVFLTSVLEAKTSQVDNLVLPLFMFIFLSWVE